tara:strand:- start:4 stop:162 length:159 start_codon:yes stop_codon:yes gene_type:complete
MAVRYDSDKKTILLACEKAGLSMSDFIVGASLEAAECIVEKYRSLPHSGSAP